MKTQKEAYDSGCLDCILDYSENTPFASIGGLSKRDKPKAPYWVPKPLQEEYLSGYVKQAEEFYGPDWKTASFSWRPTMTISKKSED